VLLCAQFPRFRHPRDGGALPEVGRNPDELIWQIKAFQHVRAAGELTPSGWQPGQVTLKPGLALIGKVGQVWKP
jgi:peroxiredoxin (alkyl hydroperoxide reductase subunit C)